MLPSHLASMRAIEQCRTEALGGHLYYCADCDESWHSYHSCHNRHCPKCQQDAAQAWLEKQHALLLPVPYFLSAFDSVAVASIFGYNEGSWVAIPGSPEPRRRD